MKISGHIPHEIVELIQLTLPCKIADLTQDSSLSSIARITCDWVLTPEQRLDQAKLFEQEVFRKPIIQAAERLGLRKTKNPSYSKYDSVVIFGSTGLSNFKIWKDLINFYQQFDLKFSKIFLLGGDRSVNQEFDVLSLAYKYFGEYFKQNINGEEILKCKNEMEIMELVSKIVLLPEAFENIPIISVFTRRTKNTQTDTKDTILELIKTQPLPPQLPILFLGTQPFIVRQGIQAKFLMPNYQIDTASIFEPYLETFETQLNGDLPSALYLDELHWLFLNMSKSSVTFNELLNDCA